MVQTTHKPAKNSPLLFLYRIIQGALIGGGAILPGVSGGVLAVVFGIYRPMMAFLSRPFKTFKQHIALFIPVIIGVGLGFWGFAGLVDLLFSGNKPLALALFVGLILGTLPLLYKEANQPENGQALGAKAQERNHIALLLGFVLLLAFLYTVSTGEGQLIQPTLLWSFVSGIIWGFSLVVPGLSSSSILLFVGIYTQLMTGVKNLDLGIVLPLLLGIALVAFLLARFVDRLFERHHGIAANAVVGLVLASTLAIIVLPPEGYQIISWGQGLLALLIAAIGFFAAHYLGKWGEGIKPKE